MHFPGFNPHIVCDRNGFCRYAYVLALALLFLVPFIHGIHYIGFNLRFIMKP